MAKETIAILGGTGDLGTGLAIRWAKGGPRDRHRLAHPAEGRRRGRRAEKNQPANESARDGKFGGRGRAAISSC